MMNAFPQMLHFFTDDAQNFLTLKKLTSLLKADFSADGSNQRQTEGKIYSAFVKYLREVAGQSKNTSEILNTLCYFHMCHQVSDNIS